MNEVTMHLCRKPQVKSCLGSELISVATINSHWTNQKCEIMDFPVQLYIFVCVCGLQLALGNYSLFVIRQNLGLTS